MIERIAREIPLFESLGLFTEAPKKKRKPRVISVRPITKDYVDTIDPDEDLDIDNIDDLGDDLSDYDSLDIDIGGDMEDYSLDDPAIEGDDDPEIDLGSDDIPTDLGEEPVEGDDDLEDLGGDIPDLDFGGFDDTTGVEEQIAEPTDPQPTETAPPAEPSPEATPEEVPAEAPVEEPPAEGGEVIDATGGEDPEATGDIDAEVDVAPVDGTDPNAQPMDAVSTDTGTESITKDDMRKYELFKRFMNFYNTLRYFIDKLENGVTDDPKFEFVVKKALLRFKNLEELTKDYMILKFQSDSFLQNSFFFEKIKASTMLILELLNLNKFEKDKK